MKVITVINGSIGVCLIPETEMETMILKDISKSPVVVSIHDKLQILNKNVSNCIVISPAVEGVKPVET
jgi:hypothetical protein